jgi:hypothetical protein
LSVDRVQLRSAHWELEATIEATGLVGAVVSMAVVATEIVAAAPSWPAVSMARTVHV